MDFTIVLYVLALVAVLALFVGCRCTSRPSSSGRVLTTTPVVAAAGAAPYPRQQFVPAHTLLLPVNSGYSPGGDLYLPAGAPYPHPLPPGPYPSEAPAVDPNAPPPSYEQAVRNEPGFAPAAPH